jgi:5-methyltetrahydropteroyltriglutamate--homocysteine methyltransferase
MKRSTDRIIMSHAGALHRPDDLRATMQARRDEDPIDDALAARMKAGIAEVVKLQHENGVDVVNDGEYTKRSWQTYSRGRLKGIEFRPLGPNDDPLYGSITARESRFFPEFFANSSAPGVQAGQGQREGIFSVAPLE